MSVALNENTLIFEDILQGFMDMDTSEKAQVFKDNLVLFLKNKSLEERKLIGKVFLSVTKENANILLQYIKENKDINMLNALEKALIKLK